MCRSIYVTIKNNAFFNIFSKLGFLVLFLLNMSFRKDLYLSFNVSAILTLHGPTINISKSADYSNKIILKQETVNDIVTHPKFQSEKLVYIQRWGFIIGEVLNIGH